MIREIMDYLLCLVSYQPTTAIGFEFNDFLREQLREEYRLLVENIDFGNERVK